MHVRKLSHNVVKPQDNKLTPKLTEPSLIQWFGEDVSKLRIYTNMINSNATFLHMVS